MKALSVRQPWAWAIIEGYKPIENRDWPTNFRGKIALHAAKGMTRDEYDAFYFFIRDNEGMWNVIENLPPFERLVRGAVLGTVEILGCVNYSLSPWFVGEYGFLVANPVQLDEPIPCRGALGFWPLPDEVERQILCAK